jgi:hypothetical protein
MDRQVAAILKEFREALEDKNLKLAGRIIAANPTLTEGMTRIFKEWLRLELQ